MTNKKEITKLFFEAGNLKMVPRSGWFLCGVKQPESVAEHSYRTALIAYVLAEKKGLDNAKAMKMALFHDLHESRINDAHKVAARYMNKKETEKKAVDAQAKDYGFLKEYSPLMKELFEEKTEEAKIVIDADYLECAFQAKEYLEQGYKNAQDWLDRIGERLITEEGKEIFKILLTSDSKEWWENLKKQ